MATLKGFPASNRIAPDKRIASESRHQSNRSYTIAAIFGFASKGPINTPTSVRDTRQLWAMFGSPHPDQGDPNMIYAAEQHLQVVNEVIIYRAADPQLARTASVPIPGADNLVKTQSTVKGPYIFKRNQFFRWKIDGTLSPKTLVVLATEPEGIQTQQLVDELNDQLSPKDGIRFYSHDEYLGVQTTFPDRRELELVSIQDAMYGPWSATGLGQEMTAAETVAKKYDYNFEDQDNLTLDIIVSGSNNVSVDGIIQTIKLKGLEGRKNNVEDVVDYLNKVELPQLPGGWRAFAAGDYLGLRTKHAGRDASIQVKPSYVANTILGFDSATMCGKSPKDAAIFFGSTNESEVSITLHADSPGVEGNNTRVIIVNEPDSDTFTMNVYSSGVLVESWGQLTKDRNSRFYVESFINLFSEWIRVEDNASNMAPPKNGAYMLGDERIAGSTRGCDGIPTDKGLQDSLLAGDADTKTGLFSIVDPTEYNIDLLAAPGRSSKKILDALALVCETRRDCLAVIDPPMELNAKETMAWIKPYESDSAALFWPWVQIRDSYNRRNVWVPPSGSVMAAIARSDALSSPWTSPVGVGRGVVPGVLDVFKALTKEEMKLLSNDPRMNVITKDSTDACVLSTQKTLGGSDINLKRMLFYVEKNVRRSIDTLLSGNLTEEEFRERFKEACEYVLGQLKDSRGIHKYTIQAEGSETAEESERPKARIGVQPREASGSYYINFELPELKKSEKADTYH